MNQLVFRWQKHIHILYIYNDLVTQQKQIETQFTIALLGFRILLLFRRPVTISRGAINQEVPAGLYPGDNREREREELEESESEPPVAPGLHPGSPNGWVPKNRWCRMEHPI